MMNDDICPICLHYKDHIAHTFRCWQIIELNNQREALQAKLDIAVEALEFIGEMPTIAWNPLWVSSYVIVRANKALAEIEKIGG